MTGIAEVMLQLTLLSFLVPIEYFSKRMMSSCIDVVS